MIKIKAEGESVKIAIDSNVEDGIAESLNLIVCLVQNLAESLNTKDITLAESLFKAIKEIIEKEEKK